MRYLVLAAVLCAGCSSYRAPTEAELREQAFRNEAERFMRQVESFVAGKDVLTSIVAKEICESESQKLSGIISRLPDARHNKNLLDTKTSMERIQSYVSTIKTNIEHAQRYREMNDEKSAAQCEASAKLTISAISDNVRAIKFFLDTPKG